MHPGFAHAGRVVGFGFQVARSQTDRSMAPRGNQL